ncbi:FadR/GntR family transcriptional regulator [Vreelandella arcis]|uniref:DNA-binding transcriptional regulator, FadR family n=1 Tax=Vreelandella arcis TaxID=416873 RepID=A0A1G9XCG3_9GAMM|nr:FCD domain-containing protein [Halomonas arcis]SDM94377.1 DNA-binding transcriptional regulator, FadR family [Halomonas arcis]
MTSTTPRRKRPEAIGEAIKEYVVAQALRPGDRLPSEEHLINALDAAKGTIREAMRGLEFQGLIQTRTGPGGGAFLSEVSDNRAMELLGNYFFFRPPTIYDIYEVRKQLEPALVASLTGQLTENDLAKLEAVMAFYDHPPNSLEEEREQRIKELEFHLLLVDHCPNPLLALMCRFPIRLLMSMTVCQRIYSHPYPELRRRGHGYQRRLIEAMRHQQTEEASAIMAEHMCAAQALMEEREAMLQHTFFRADASTSRDYLALNKHLASGNHY